MRSARNGAVGIEAVGIGQDALDRASTYAKERVVFGRPIAGYGHIVEKITRDQLVDFYSNWVSRILQVPVSSTFAVPRQHLPAFYCSVHVRENTGQMAR